LHCLRSNRFVPVAALGILALGTWSCSSFKAKKVSAETVQRVTVPVAEAKREDLSSGLELAAEFHPYLDVELHAKVAGYLKDIYVDIGDRVKAGQLLAVLEVPELADELREAAAQIERDESEVSRARDDLARAKSAHAATHSNYTRLARVSEMRPELVAQQEVDDAQAKDLVGEAQVSAAEAALSAALQQAQVAQANQSKLQTMQAYCKITAPFTGVITKRYADPGAMIPAGITNQNGAMPVVRLAKADLLRLILPVPESVVPRVHLGGSVAVRVPALNRTFEGKVARFTEEVQFNTRTMDTEVDVPNPKLELVPGMYAYATLALDQRPDALAVPLQAVATSQNVSTVMVINAQQQLEERQVKLGIETPSMVEVLGGLKENDLVVIGSRSQYKPGELVEPKLVDPSELKG
jgi:RND family efflux transporter MFP subunit